MEKAFLSENFERIQSFCENNGLVFTREQVENNHFDVEVAIDENGNYVDFRVFDPYQKVFDGYVYADGWSNWMLENYTEE